MKIVFLLSFVRFLRLLFKISIARRKSKYYKNRIRIIREISNELEFMGIKEWENSKRGRRDPEKYDF